jgi:catechol 2,3-dioxygenase-like lactoylglutathione lyase family enzyme
MEARGFSRDDFARFHPSGALGKRLLLRVSDVMRSVVEIAVVSPTTDVLAVIREMTRAAVGVACVVDGESYVGLISEGDLRRHLLAHSEKLEGTAMDMVNPLAATTDGDLLAVEALEAFQNHPKKIGEMPVPFGLMHRLAYGESFIKLIDPKVVPEAGPLGLTKALGFRYLTFQVSNIDEVCDECAKAGLKFDIPKQELMPGVTIAMVRDPDGNVVEFVQRA